MLLPKETKAVAFFIYSCQLVEVHIFHFHSVFLAILLNVEFNIPAIQRRVRVLIVRLCVHNLLTDIKCILFLVLRYLVFA